ncbi:hypothetical protein MPSEU_000535100 [Mayamaea pseudoterrestris]|nr:hypothetical protein MPSEU_000535100 [Mayamaea pseudoterrestris]
MTFRQPSLNYLGLQLISATKQPIQTYSTFSWLHHINRSLRRIYYSKSSIVMSAEQTQSERDQQDAKFKDFKAPESVYKKPTPTKTQEGKAFTGVSPMDFFMRQNAAKKAEKAKEQEQKSKLYQNNMGKAFFSE